MKNRTDVKKRATVAARNIGGIDDTSVALSPGVNVLKGRNSTNRTSFLRAIMAGLGSDDVRLKGDADEGHVRLTIDGASYTRTIRRDGRTITTDGDPYLEEPEVGDLFAFLLEDNETRQAVVGREDLRAVIMRPVDTAAIEREVATAKRRRDDIDERLSEIDAQKQRLPELTERRTSLREQLAEKEEELASIRADLEELDAGVEETQAQREAFKRKLASLNEVRADLEDVESRLESARDQTNALVEERDDLQEERASLSTSVKEISDIGQQIGTLQERKRTLGSLVDRLQNIIQFNENLLDDGDSELQRLLTPPDEPVVDQLLPEETLTCWSCGSEVAREDLEATLADLRELAREKRAERTEVAEELQELRDRKRELEQGHQRREQIEQQLEQIDDRIEQQRDRVESLQSERESLEADRDTLECEVSEMELEGNEDRILERNKRKNELRVSIDSLKDDLESVEQEIEAIEAAVDERSALESEREEVSRELTSLRTRIADLEDEAVAAFNEHMENLIDRLEYDNLGRIWIECHRESEPTGDVAGSDAEFRLHVVRRTDDGAAYEDTIDHLSESEREVTGLIFALAGYLAHDVHDEVPFILLDSLEAIDATRIAAFIEYVEEYAEYLVVALLPEDAQSLEAEYTRITEI